MKKTVWDWEVLNDNKAIWLRPSSDVSDEDYDKFYKAISKVKQLRVRVQCRQPGYAKQHCGLCSTGPACAADHLLACCCEDGLGS